MCTRADLEKITTSVGDEALRIFSDKLNSVILYGSYARSDFGGTTCFYASVDYTIE